MEILCWDWDIVYVSRGKVSGIILGLILPMKCMNLALASFVFARDAWVLASHRLHRHANHKKVSIFEGQIQGTTKVKRIPSVINQKCSNKTKVRQCENQPNPIESGRTRQMK
jgi:hypothetical protein